MTEKEIKARVDFLSSAKCNHTPHKYIDITGDLIQGTLLSRILYWFAEDKNKQRKVRIFKDGYFWIAKQRKDWWEEIRISERQYDKAIKGLEEKGFVVLAKYKFNSMPTIHIRPDYDNINDAVEKWEDKLRKEIIKESNEELQNCENGNNTKRKSQGNDTKCKTGVTQEGNLLTGITNNDYSNKDYNTENTDKYALKDKSFKDCDNMYASVSEKQEVEKKPKKKSRYIPKDYTEEQLREHIRPAIKENFERIEFENELEHIPDGEKLLEDITVEFFRQYEENMGVKHNILPDKSYINVIRMFVCSTGELREYFDLETYKIMITRYFQTDFNRYGKYDGEVTLCLSHFMNDTIRNHLLNREGILWERAEDEED